MCVVSLSHLGRYRPIGVFIEHVEGLLERLELVLPQLLVDVEGRCGEERYSKSILILMPRRKLKWFGIVPFFSFIPSLLENSRPFCEIFLGDRIFPSAF